MRYQGARLGVLAALLAAGLGATSLGASQRLPKHADASWYFVTEAADIRVYARDRPGQALPVSRAFGEVQADFFTIAAVLADVSRHCEWMTHCMHAEALSRRGDLDQIFYQQVSAPWPVMNRDVVLRVRSDYRPRFGEMLIRFATIEHPAQPERDDFVRMPRLNGFYHLRALGPALSRVTLEMDADPGGLLPDWLVKLVTRSYPLDTLRNLRRQIDRTRGVYDAEVARLKATYGDYALSPVSAGADQADRPQMSR